MKLALSLLLFTAVVCGQTRGAEARFHCPELAAFAQPPPSWSHRFGSYPSLLRDGAGRPITNAAQWAVHRTELRAHWDKLLGAWTPLIDKPRIETLSETNRDGLVQRRVRVETAPGQTSEGYLLLPRGPGPFPAVFVPYYEPESSVGLGKVQLRDFAYQLARRGFVTLAIGSPGGDARRPPETPSQPLHFLAYVAANSANALARLPQVDAARIGVAGHSYGGKWAMFAAAFHERFACGVWSDPGIVFDEARANVNYWEPWYLGFDPHTRRARGIVTPVNPRTGAYKRLVEEQRDLTEVMALMAPRPFLVSGGAEDQPERWQPLNRVREVYALFGETNAVLMTNRATHDPTPESNEQIYRFFECALGK
jgi:hypothetical protein